MKVKYVPNGEGWWATKCLDFETSIMWNSGKFDYDPFAFIRFLFSL